MENKLQEVENIIQRTANLLWNINEWNYSDPEQEEKRIINRLLDELQKAKEEGVI